MQKMKAEDLENAESVHDIYVQAFRVGEVVTRRELAEVNNIPYSTVVYNLEQAVKFGKLNKQKRIVRGYQTWVYALPETMPMLPGVK